MSLAEDRIPTAPPLPPVRRVCWRPCWRLVSSRFPPQTLFDRVARPADLEIVFEIEGLTNDRLRQEAGDLRLVPPEDRVSGPGTTPIMAAFTHLRPEGSRFTDGTYGVYYAAKTIATAIAETCFHRARFLAATGEPPLEIDLRSYASDLDGALHDIRGQREAAPALYDPDPAHYGAPQAFAADLRARGSNGIVYDSVRDPRGECVAILRPPVLSPVRQGPHYCYVWDGREISAVYEKRLHRP
jgi:hypothetical protein